MSHQNVWRFIYLNFFTVKFKGRKKTLNTEISSISVKNPLPKENEVWLASLLKSKYDGQKINKLIYLSISIDISYTKKNSRINR